MSLSRLVVLTSDGFFVSPSFWLLTILIRALFALASFCSNGISFRSNNLARISLVHGGLLVRGSKHLVSYPSTCPIQAQGQDTSFHYRICLPVVLSLLGCHSNLFVPRNYVHFCDHVLWCRGQIRCLFPLAHDLHPSAFLFMSPQLEMVVWSFWTSGGQMDDKK